MESYNGKNITTATTTLVKTGMGVLHTIVVSKAAAGTVIVYDGITSAGTVLATLKASIGEGTYIFDIAFSTGLTIVTGSTNDITVSFS